MQWLGVSLFVLIAVLQCKKGVEVCKSKIRCFKSVKEQVNKRKLGLYLTDKLKVLSKDSMGTFSKENASRCD